ncbi:sugar O-acyltransferase (sialic acid O-acetyltransferase NeuD family) [Pseudomonas sp. BIGb0450]|jgi:sugar O-acyltransferase (sialic acid O-acetyltransferase NeuD family)|uniref:acetyltransferase n=1 Tax=unclassified Pseudomonas TaxID=196821 RepID=UPI0021691520|nr:MULTISPECIES: acetyltransferase [unclassified Pseudomonas]MCS3418399.1 sugar O-acyltransferase (sialic acid O-acetyltransferase NeuD family) [Pseudomonas sp. BIGb0558]MCS3437998.1 sugar O-acyltransferase (sialic acid O-acetyltransferase NeuD family) [Pseudomonas sp. BIGb0450]
MDTFAIFGAGGFGREIMPLVASTIRGSRLVFIDDRLAGTSVNGFEVISGDEFAGLDGDRFFNIAIAGSQVRETIANRMIAAGAKPFSISASNTLSLTNNEIGEGAIMCPFSMVTSNAKIGRFFHANLYSYVAHDCVIGDFVTFAPSVHCNGAVVIGDHAYIGTGAVIKQGAPDRPIVIGAGAIVGMGAVVTKSVAPNTTVVGNPARVLERGQNG